MTTRILGGISHDGRVYIDIRDLVEALRANGNTDLADQLAKWESEWRAEYEPSRPTKRRWL